MHAPVPPLRETAAFQDMADRFLTSPHNFLPVVNAAGRLLGVVALHDLKNFLNAGPEMAGVIALDLLREVPLCLTPDQRLMDALPALLAVEMRNVPVVSTKTERRLIGSVARAEILGALADEIAAGRRRNGGG
jgi:CIC family chloride channel protein